MLAGISGATPGSASGAVLDDNDGSVLLQAPRKIVSADAVAKLASVRALRELIIVFPRAIEPLPSSSQAQNSCRSNDVHQLRRGSDLVSVAASYIGLKKALTPLFA
jgi:hypothetical protein